MAKIVINIPSLEQMLKPIIKRLDVWHIILMSAILRFFVMPFPSDGGQVFDEAHYVPAANAILQMIPANAEHPPLTKLIVAGFIWVFGNFWFSWRFPIVISALAATWLVYRIALKFMRNVLALAATFLICFDIIWFIHGNIFLLEIPSIAFGLAFILLWMDAHYVWSSICFGLSFLCNEKVLFFLLAFIIYEVFMLFHKNPHPLSLKTKNRLRTIFKNSMIFFVVGVLLVSLGGLWINDSIWKPASETISNIGVHATVYENSSGNPVTTVLTTVTTITYKYITNPIAHLIFMWNYFTAINANLTTPTQDYRPPISWITPFGQNPFDAAVYYRSVVSLGSKSEILINYVAQVPIFIWYMTLPILAVAIWFFKKDPFAKFYVAMFLGTWLPRELADMYYHNTTFVHYFLYTIPAVCIGIPWFWDKVGGKYKYYFLFINIVAAVIFFFCFFPIGLVQKL